MVSTNIKNNKLLLIFGIFFLGFFLKIAVSLLGSNFDLEMWKLNLYFFQNGESFYDYGRYNYSPFWIYLLNKLTILIFLILKMLTYLDIK